MRVKVGPRLHARLFSLSLIYLPNIRARHGPSIFRYSPVFIGCNLPIMSSTGALGPELIDLLPELSPASGGVGQCPQAEHDLGALGFPAHTGGAQALLDQALAGGLGDPSKECTAHQKRQRLKSVARGC